MPRRLDVSWLLVPAMLMLIWRLPASVIALLLVPLVVVVVRGLRLRSGLHAPLLWTFFAVALASSVLSLLPTGQVFGINAASIMLALFLVAVAGFRTGAPRQVLRWLTTGLYLGFTGCYLLGVYEVASGNKMLAVMYPDSAEVPLVQANRILATAVFPNYNDFSVALVALCAFCLARLLFGKGRSQLGLLWDAVVLLTSMVWVTAMGSRGSLLAVLLLGMVLLLTSVMALHPRLVTPRRFLVALVLLLGVAGMLWNSPWLQDNSTNARVDIIHNALAMMGRNPFHAAFGWGSYADYKAAAAIAYPDTLMDTHNIFLEYAVTYGVFTLLAFVVNWVVLVYRGLLQHQTELTWRTMSLFGLLAVLPVIGVVPSSLLRYRWVELVLVGCWLAVATWRREHAVQPAVASTVPQPALAPIAYPA